MSDRASGLDWEAIEREFRAGQLSVNEIARQHGCSHTAINKKAAAKGWVRDLTARVRQATNARLVAETVSSDQAAVAGFSVETAISAAADRAVALVRDHRQAIKVGRGLVDMLVRELVQVTQQNDEIAATIRDVTAGQGVSGEGDCDDSKPDLKRRAMMLRAISLPARAATIRDLAAAMKTLVTLERQAFNLDDDTTRDKPGNSLGSLIEQVVKLRHDRSMTAIDITPPLEPKGEH